MTGAPSDTPPIDAATLVVLRDTATAPPASATPSTSAAGSGARPTSAEPTTQLEVLMLQRNSRGFFGGMWVFPGGRVERADRDAAGDVVAPCDPLAAQRTPACLDSDLRGFRTAAVRETQEEAGIDLSDVKLAHFAHWLPPPIRPKRFSTHFFACEAPADLEAVTADGSEIVGHAWVTPEAALSRRAAGEIEFVTPTFVTLSWLSGFKRAADVLASANGHTCFHTEIINSTDADDPGYVAVYVGDAAFPDGDLNAPGPRRRCVMLRSGWHWLHHP